VVTASGKIRPETQVKVSADVGGYIRKLTVEEGNEVKEGQLLVQVDPEVYKARVLEAQAAEQTTKARLKLAEASETRAGGEARRVLGLYRKDLTSASNLERAQADLAIAQAEVEAAKGQLLQAQAALSKARSDLLKCTIRAPMSGTVIELQKELGERVSGGDFREDIIMTVADLSRMEVEVEVGERDVVLISEDDEVDIEVDAYPGKSVPGKVTEIANAGVTRNPWTESEVTNFRVVVRVGESNLRLRPQMSATVRIRTAHKDLALTVPIQSVTLRRPSEIEEPQEPGASDETPRAGQAGKADGRGAEQPVEVVFVLQNGKAIPKKVETGLSSDTRIEIMSGIEEGTRVVSGPYRALSKDLELGSLVTTEGSNGQGKRKRSGDHEGR
jgi:HlyD family secretion protein